MEIIDSLNPVGGGSRNWRRRGRVFRVGGGDEMFPEDENRSSHEPLETYVAALKRFVHRDSLHRCHIDHRGQVESSSLLYFSK